MNLPALPRKYNVAIIGDIMIDHYVYGTVTRKSPEADIDILEYKSDSKALGGAANVALNILNLGCNPILISCVGDDTAGKQFNQIAIGKGLNLEYLIEIKSRRTTVKKRFFNEDAQILRVDNEDTSEVAVPIEQEIISSLSSAQYKYGLDAILIQDYNKGVLTSKVIHDVMQLASDHKVKVFVDPKEKNFFAYQGCFLFKPNKRELSLALGKSEISSNEIPKLAKELRQKMKMDKVIVTLSEEGIYGLAPDFDGIVPALPSNIKDVCGAGDTVISCLCVAELLQMSTQKALEFGNYGARSVCEQTGVKPIQLY